MANQVMLFGNLGQDPELRHTPSGATVATLSLATTESWMGKDGNKQEETQWHRIILWNKQAEIAGKYLRKGNKVLITGKITSRTYEDKQGATRYVTEIIAKTMEFGGNVQRAEQEPRPQGQGAVPPQQAQAPQGTANLDDIPF